LPVLFEAAAVLGNELLNLITVKAEDMDDFLQQSGDRIAVPFKRENAAGTLADVGVTNQGSELAKRKMPGSPLFRDVSARRGQHQVPSISIGSPSVHSVTGPASEIQRPSKRLQSGSRTLTHRRQYVDRRPNVDEPSLERRT
jgi:hypothetical protein